MEEIKTPILYQEISHKLQEKADMGEIALGEARRIMTYIFRVPKQKVSSIFTEMETMGIIKIVNCRYIRVNGVGK